MKFLNKITSSILLTGLGVFGTNYASAQNESTLSFIDNIYQSSYYSPFNESDFNLSIGLPGVSSVYTGVTNSGFSISDFYPNGIDQPLDPQSVIDNMRDNEFIGADLQVDLFHFQWQFGKQAFSFHVREHVNSQFTYSRNMLDLAWNGNGAFLDQDLDLSGFGLSMQHYREYAVGFSRRFDKLFVSGRGKLLFGKYAADLEANNLKAEISNGESDIYEHSVSGDLSLNVGGFDIDPFDDDLELNNQTIQDYMLNSKNTGLGLDLAASYDITTRFQVNAAVTNIGFISWKESTSNVTLNDEFVLEGVDFFDVAFDDEEGSGFENYLDSLAERFDESLIDTTNEKFRTGLPWNISAGARYEFLKNTYAVGRLSVYNSAGLRGALSLGVYHDFLRWLNIGVTNTITNKKIMNIGAGLVLKPGPFQIYMVSDFLTAARFTRANQFNLRVGMNLVFGKAAKPEKLTSVLN